MTAGSGTLAGRRIVVTRRADQAGELVRALRERGATVRLVPTTAIGPPADPAPLDAALGELGRFDWVAFTSANAVEAVRDRLAQRGRIPALGTGGPRIASVGPATTRALAAAFPSVTVALEPADDFRAAGLLRAFEDHAVSGSSILLPVSSQARDELPSGLRRMGAEVTAVVAYSTVEPPGLEEAVGRCLDEGFDAVTFAAPSAARAFAAAAGGRSEGRPAVVIGPTTGDGAGKEGFRVLATAAPSTVEGLVAALEGALGRTPGPR